MISEIQQRRGGKKSTIIREIINTAIEFQSCTFIHESRTFNFEVHGIAKFACNLALGHHLWLGSPPDQVLVPLNAAVNK